MPDAGDSQRFSAVRAISIGSVLLVVGSFWIIVQELLLNAGSLTSSSPPVGAVGLFMAVLSVVLLLQFIKMRWQLGRKELLIIYCMLMTFLPLASQGLWYRFVGMIVDVRTTWFRIPTPEHMMPRGPELIVNGAFEQELTGWEGNARPQRITLPDETVAACAVLDNQGDAKAGALIQVVSRKAEDGSDRFIPGQKFVIDTTFRRVDFTAASFFSLSTSIDGERWQQEWSLGHESSGWMGYPENDFDRTVSDAFEIPHGASKGLWLRWQLTGPGQMLIDRVSFHSNEAAYQLLEGSSEISDTHEDRIERDDRARLQYRPEADTGLQRWLYDLRGYTPWRLWKHPLLSWGLLWIAMFGAMFSLAAILFRQWSDREKLTFPLTIFPLMLTEADPNRSGYALRIVRSKALWFGVGTALAVYGLNGLNFYNANVPQLPLELDLAPFLSRPPWSAMMADGRGLVLRVILLGVGVAFFMDLQMAFNLWFFFLACKLWMVIPFYQGKLGTPLWQGGPSYGDGVTHLQGIGAAIGIVLVVLWLGRNQLVAVFRKAVVGDKSIDDSREPMPYRLAVITLLLSIVLLGVWGEISGAGWLFGVLGMGLMLVFAVMAARVRAECAAPGMWIVPSIPVLLLMAFGGIFRFGMLPMSYFVLAGSFMCVGYFLMLMPALMESFQIGKVAGIGRKPLGIAMVIGFVVAIAGGGYVLLDWGYARGLSTMRGTIKDEAVLWRWKMENFTTRQTVDRHKELAGMVADGKKLTTTDSTELAKLEELPSIRDGAGVVGVGVLITCGLAAARLLLMSFPFHPLGYALATTQLMSVFWFSMLLAWLIRLAALRLGGVRMIRNQVQPYMIGLILGSVGSVLLWDVVGIVKVAQGFTGQVYVTW
jgi:hypothetical protein